MTTQIGVRAADAGSDSANAAAASLDHVTKRFGSVVAVDDISLDVAEGEFFAMLGPSGSGKTTLLRLLAGFEQPTVGRITLHGVDVTDVPPFERDVNTVFQDYALFPHMNVAQNVEYGLKVRKVAKSQRATQVTDALAVVRLEGFEGRRPGQLSGGQRQRVALARALVNRPRILLLDEPLGALDRQLREEMQVELKQIQQLVGITFVFVTHDQGEALAMSDRVAVFNHGRIEQVGTPSEIYEDPQTEFVAAFVGTSNLLSGEVVGPLPGDAPKVSVRPERMRLADLGAPVGDGEIAMEGTVADVQYLGAGIRSTVSLDDDTQIVVDAPNSGRDSATSLATRGRRVHVVFHNQDARRIDDVTVSDTSTDVQKGEQG